MILSLKVTPSRSSYGMATQEWRPLRDMPVYLLEPPLEQAKNEDSLVLRSKVIVTARTLLISACVPKIFFPKFMMDSRVILAGSFLLSATARTN